MNAYHPFWEIGIGTGLLLLVLFAHGFALFAIQNRFDSWFPHLASRPHFVLSKVLIGGVVLSLLSVHYVEILMWAAAMYAVGALPDMRSAFYFAGGAYTTYGSGDLYLPANWRLLGFMIATSGLFTFAWTTGILIGVMNRYLHAGRGEPGLPGNPVNEVQTRLVRVRAPASRR
jgi:Ion channel